MRERSVSVIIPVYNESGTVRTTVRDVSKILSGIEHLDWEIIIVDDGSTDGCGYRRDFDLGESCRGRVRWLRHPVNRGYGSALKTGLRPASFDTIVITDADGTYPSSAIPRLLCGLDAADMVVGSRTGRNVQYSPVRKMAKAFLKLLAEWIAGESIPDLNSGLRVFRKSDIEPFERLLPDGFSFTTTITLAMLTRGMHVHFEPIDYAARIGRSKFRPVRDTWNFCVTVLRIGVFFAPLKIFLPVATIFLAAGLVTLFGDIFIRQDITDRTVIFFMAAIQLGMFALLADMISRK